MNIMDKENMKRTFPCYRNADGTILFDKSMLPVAAQQQDFENVYRLCLNGKLNSDSFLCTYLDKFNIRDRDLSDSGTFSTSCFNKIRGVKQCLKFMRRNHPNVIVAKGSIKIDSGFSYLDKPKTGHIHWWIFVEEKPEDYFSIIKEGELNENN